MVDVQRSAVQERDLAVARGRRAAPTLTPIAPDAREHDPAPPQRPSRLKMLLGAIDALAVAIAWATWAAFVTIGPPSRGADVTAAALATVATLATVAVLHLYRSRVCAVHSVEVVGLAKAAMFAGVALQTAKDPLGLRISVADIAVGALFAFVALLAGRRAFRGWLSAQRRKGRHLRSVVVVGTNDEGRALVAMLRRNPEAGYQVIGLLGDRHGTANSGVVPWLGPESATAEVVERLGANGAFLAASALSPAQLNESVRELMANGDHVHLSSSLRGISSRRVRLQPISREMMFHLEPARLGRWEQLAKRGIDIVLATVGLVASAPVLLVAGLIIKLQDRGPVLFRQERVGRAGAHFTLLKLRTMAPDAEHQLEALLAHNERDGVLFKLEDDPRVTAIGKVLRAASLDEVPQLWNVIRGEMSLVGPRPALPSEVVHFEERLLARHEVTPGVTGLWQVEAREVPGLGAYTRLDLFYVENWSVGLDLAIIFSTVTAIAGRTVRILLRRPLAAES